MKIKFVDLTEPTEQIREKFLAETSRLLDGANFILTPEVEAFEKAWVKT